MHRKRDTLTASTQVANHRKICEFYPKRCQNDTQLATSGDLKLSSYSLYNINLQTKNGKNVFKPLYAFSLKSEENPLSQEAIEFLTSNPNPDLLSRTSEKLRWYRYKNNLLQKDIAKKIGIDRSTYIHYESTTHDLYPQDKLKKLANLFGINIKKLLDDYNLFLYNGQGKQIKALRNAMGLTISEFARLYKTYPQTIRKWEKDEVIIFKSTWEKLFNET